MNIKDSELTGVELYNIEEAMLRTTQGYRKGSPEYVALVKIKTAEAQLAKALWGVVDWLRKARGSHFETVEEHLVAELELLGIPRPGGEG